MKESALAQNFNLYFKFFTKNYKHLTNPHLATLFGEGGQGMVQYFVTELTLSPKGKKFMSLKTF